MVLRIVPSAAERMAGSPGSDTIEHASRTFRTDGALIVEDIVDTAIIADARREFARSYSRYLDGGKHADALQVGKQRLMMTVDMTPPFDNPQLFANPFLLPVLSAALDDFVIGAYGAVCSLPSAPAQHRHWDGGLLFPFSAVNQLLPATAITVAIPLIEMNKIQGTTALWLGTHRDLDRSMALRDPSRREDFMEGSIEPVVREGSCILWDFRLIHSGTPNQSTTPRPLLYLTYCRPWFLDHRNFKPEQNPKQKPLLVNADILSRLPAQQQRLLARAQVR